MARDLQLTPNFSFRYELVAYDKNYEKYMVAFGIPSFLVSLILGWSETIIVKESTKADDVYIFKTITSRKYVTLH